eukprot:CAMPEP_0185036208 /NCGR_PEP_ID=MMETSP1103-20130426/28823_1 /TAXON_ID=36769 /ORGANISM="Paraphysomonas bandaiensis, Strain Caron Lab Isolate" /LENGTH=553 /DNA_ID=CAMNT_0027573663 /DNA_START=23 /DNA_END=1684 /DNA_ORIENTATION=+
MSVPLSRIGFKNYTAALKHLNSVNSILKAEGILAPSSMSLANTFHLYELIGKPLDRIPTIHIGGTNGKGSTCLKMSSTLSSIGVRTGLFVSPHIASCRERIQVDGELISEDDFVTCLDRVVSLCNDHSIPATYFEIIFIMSCLRFEAAKCDAVVLEVGVGGEWDATNVISSALAVICSVGMDHMRILGDTLEKIATTKSGIFKRGGIGLIGPSEVESTMRAVGESRGCVIHSLYDSLDTLSSLGEIPRKNTHPLTKVVDTVAVNESHNEEAGDRSVKVNASHVDTDILNSQIALAGLCLLKQRLNTEESVYPSTSGQRLIRSMNLTDASILDRIISARPPCRWEEISLEADVSPLFSLLDDEQPSTAPRRVKIKVILDIGHNAPAIEALVHKAQDRLGGLPVRVLCGMSRDKDANTCLRLLSSLVPVDKIHFVQSSNFRALSTTELENIVSKVHTENLPSSDSHTSTSVPVELKGSVLFDPASSSFTRTSEGTNTMLRRVLGQMFLECSQGAYQQGEYAGALLVCGSGYIMSQTKLELGIDEPNDIVALERDS